MREFALLHQGEYESYIVVGGSAVLLHWLVKGIFALPDLQPRLTTDIDIAVADEKLRSIFSGEIAGATVEVLHMHTEDAKRRTDFAFQDALSVELQGIKVQFAGVAALFVMKTGSADAPGRWTKRGSDLRDMCSLLRLYGAQETTRLLALHKDNQVVVETVKRLRQMLAREESRGYKWLFEEMSFADADGVWTKAAFDQLFNELHSAGFAAE